MSNPVWAISDDGQIEYVSVQKEHIPGIIELMRTSFFVNENVSIACDIPGNVEAMKELEDLVIKTIHDGVSVVAVEKDTKKVLGAAFNKIQVNEDTDSGTYFENFAKNCKQSSSRALVQFMIDADGACDLFKLCNIDCLLEIMFLGVLSDYGRRGIGTKVCEISVHIARELKNGRNVKKPFDNDTRLFLGPVPKAVSAIFTSFKSQAIGRKLGFTIAKKISFEEFTYEGKTFASKIGKETPDTTVEYLLL